MRYVIYGRVSTGFEEQETSFETQMTELQNRVSVLYPDYTLVGTYGDQGISGTKENRPDFQKMLEDARNKKFEAIITKSISRFARNTRVLLSTLEELTSLGVKVIFLEENIDSSQASQQFLLTILGALAQMESQNTSSHLRETYAIKRASGKLARPCACCFGYKYDKTTDTINVLEEEAKIVKQIFSWLIDDNLSQGKIASLLTDSGIPTPYGKKYWVRPQITKILTCEKYIGNARESDRETGKVFYFEGVYPPILEVSTFQKAQDIIQSRKRTDYHRRPASLYALSHKCVCTCGRHATRFTRKGGKSYELEDVSQGATYWGCASIAENKNAYNDHNCYRVSEEYIYEAIIETITDVACTRTDLLEEDVITKDDFNSFFEAIKESDRHFEADLVSYEQRKKDLERERQKEIKLFKNDIITEEELKGNISLIDKKLRELKPPKTPEIKMMNKEHLKSFLSAVSSKDKETCRTHLFELFKDEEFKRSVVNSFVEKVIIGGDPKYQVGIELKRPLAFHQWRYSKPSPYTRNGVVKRERPGTVF